MAGSLREAALICARQWDGIYYRAVPRADEVAVGEHRRAELLMWMLADADWLDGRALNAARQPVVYAEYCRNAL